MKKDALRHVILEELRRELARQKSAAELARDEAISEESQPENKWDTHSQEAAYLAEGQARIAGEISGNIELYSTLPLPDFSAGDAIALGAVVALSADAAKPRATAWYFVGPRAGGLEITAEGRTLLVLTPQSPLGRQLIGRRVGESVQSVGRGAGSALRIVAVE